ncbi:hypothetical protein OS493_013922 [Desmophyllum pertusum]|uniref:Small ribosomal subunit protein uS15m n=1 Tax=Desmophyllum pertusum TaxID=174260 RepID=A0A9X0D459_9CNID|nr:hypothetical protein OS493_013922 [Desmophyllum pertusum]
MSLLRRLFISSSHLAFPRIISTYGGNSSISPIVKLPAIFSQPCCSKNFSTVDLHTDSWTSGRKYISGFEDIEELHNAPEEVKRVFCVQNASQLDHRNVAVEKLREQYTDEEELYIAKLSVKIEAVRKNNNDGKRGALDKHNKVFLNWLICQQRKKLRRLKDTRFERYLELLKELDLTPLESPHSKWNKYKFKEFKIGIEIKEKKPGTKRMVIKN